jgi:SAM-dependent methyltransferase
MGGLDAIAFSSPAMTYVLGTDAAEKQRLQRQHNIWRADCLSSWDRAGFGRGDRLLDLGCGPGFGSLDLAQRVGPKGQVLGLDQSPSFIEHLQQQAQQLGLPQLRCQLINLGEPLGSNDQAKIEPGSWDGAWCRWLCMFLADLDPLLDLCRSALRPGGRLVLHEYIRWDSFSLHPRGTALAKFVRCCIQHWRAQGGDPDVASRLPELLQQRGFRLLDCRSLMACSRGDQAKALWLKDFLGSYPERLAAAGLWQAADQGELEQELTVAAGQPSLWVTPALVEQIWELPPS